MGKLLTANKHVWQLTLRTAPNVGHAFEQEQLQTCGKKSEQKSVNQV